MLRCHAPEKASRSQPIGHQPPPPEAGASGAEALVSFSIVAGTALSSTGVPSTTGTARESWKPKNCIRTLFLGGAYVPSAVALAPSCAPRAAAAAVGGLGALGLG